MPAEKLASLSTNRVKDFHSDWKEMVRKVLHQRDEKDIVIITGSLYFIAEVRQWLQEGER